ncbi:vacuolar protein sorting-associated protein 13B-like [Lingula anatina]|uniref:Vacuolar protein sorting-associated protein 13B-like n=1 Tax=Lingula anatina TaxID=7574 RepID=A0A2R2MKP4_LINAN|nr:vacuolar protein sorting-associated protein 13B-like [Lingula anatina]|eukprot:XP_023930773.1 vacuolar protein sorting-associated protein 13B-like [Lingula anatina]
MKRLLFRCWKDLIAKSRSRSGSLEEKEERIQNPALEWNQLLQRDEESEVKVFPLCASCDLRIVLAPAIVETSVTKSNIVCGYSAEVNVTSDMDFYLSTNQVGLFWDIFTTNITSGTVKQQCQKDRGHHATREAISKAKSSEISETQSTISDGTTQRAETTSSQRFSSQEKGVNPLKGVTPFDILLTAGRISFTCYSHRVAKDHCRKDSTLENLLSQIKASGHSATRKRSDLEEPLDKMEEDKSAESFCSFERSESVYYTPQNSMSEAIHEENLDQDNGGQAGQSDEGVIDTVPYFYAYFSQPHSVASCHPDRQKLEMSCYDVTLKGAKSGYILEDPFKMLPDLGDFTAHWVETRAGETDPKTGIPPSLYTFKAENFLTGKAGLTVSIERPLKLNLSLVLLEQVKELVQETLEQLRQREQTTVAARQSSETVQQTTGEKELTTNPDCDPAESTEMAPGSVPAYVRYLSAIRNINIGTVQMVVAMTTVPHEEHAGILMALSQFQAGIELEADEGALSAISISAWLSNILVKTQYHSTVRPLLGPLSTSMDAQLQWIVHSGPRWLPQVCASVECGPVQICVGQEHALCMLTLAKHWSIYNKILQQATSVHTEPGSTREKRREKTKKTRKNDQGVSSVDDLRTGAFQYVFTNDTPDVTPEAGEIVFGSDEEEDVAFMAWCYPEARLLTKVHVAPVPFSTSQLSPTGKVDCVLQYWCILNKNYIDYQQFQITEGNDCQVELPGLQDKPTVAQVWRVLIYHGDREERSQSESPDPVVSPMTLAASMRVDSCILPALVPAVRFQCTASVLVMRMSNHFQHLGKATPSKLCPFYLDNCSPSDQDVLTITVDDPSFDMSMWMGEALQTTGQVTGIGQCDIVEYRNLTTQTLVDPVAASASIQYTLETEVRKMDKRADTFT